MSNTFNRFILSLSSILQNYLSCILQSYFPAHIQVVFLLQPHGFFQRAFSDFRSKFKEELEYKVYQLCINVLEQVYQKSQHNFTPFLHIQQCKLAKSCIFVFSLASPGLRQKDKIYQFDSQNLCKFIHMQIYQ